MRCRKRFETWGLMVSVLVLASGCTVTLVQRLPGETDQLRAELESLRAAKRELEERLASQIGDQQAKVELQDRGLVITVLDAVLFDSGKAELRSEAVPVLDKVIAVLKGTLRDHQIGIEGHTDNEPIHYSGWKSNWELSTARATSVLHYLVDKKAIDPARVAAIGYGEQRPVASNATAEGRRTNRRVEIVILANTVTRTRAESAPHGSK